MISLIVKNVFPDFFTHQKNHKNHKNQSSDNKSVRVTVNLDLTEVIKILNLGGFMKKCFIIALVLFSFILNHINAQWKECNGPNMKNVRALATSGNYIFAGTMATGKAVVFR